MEKHGVVEAMAVLGTEKRRKVDYSPSEMCLSMLYGLMMGIFRPSHMMELAADKVFQRIICIRGIPSQSTISRFLAKITVHKADHLAEINQLRLASAFIAFSVSCLRDSLKSFLYVSSL